MNQYVCDLQVQTEKYKWKNKMSKQTLSAGVMEQTEMNHSSHTETTK